MNWLYKTAGIVDTKNTYVVYWKTTGDGADVLIQLKSKEPPNNWERFTEIEVLSENPVIVGNLFGEKKILIKFHNFGKVIKVNFSEVRWAFLSLTKN